MCVCVCVCVNPVQYAEPLTTNEKQTHTHTHKQTKTQNNNNKERKTRQKTKQKQKQKTQNKNSGFSDQASTTHELPVLLRDKTQGNQNYAQHTEKVFIVECLQTQSRLGGASEMVQARPSDVICGVASGVVWPDELLQEDKWQSRIAQAYCRFGAALFYLSCC